MMKDLAGKVAFITGGGSGVGLGMAKVFSAAGMNVVIADIRQDHLDQAMAYFNERNAQVHGIHLDITDRKAMAEAADEAERVFGKVQLLCNNAGVNLLNHIEKVTYDDWDWLMNVNLNGVINGIQTFVPRMIEYGKGGHIVNTASMSAFYAIQGSTVYTTSKFAVRGMSEALRLDLEPRGIGVSVLCPGAVNTNIHESVVTRPQQLSDTKTQVDAETMNRMKAFSEGGMDPVKLGEKVLEAVENNAPYIIPYSEFRGLLTRLHNVVLDAMPLPENDPDAIKRVETMNKHSKSNHNL
ncbi:MULTISPECIES: SDR family NAD(P)-dependent oxidoreductase [Paenibacillus]|nr:MULTISPECIES: SDR family NAD(P)-dependent oxidoreductase [Paenibacillus]